MPRSLISVKAVVVVVALVALAWAQVWSIVTVAGLIGVGWTLLAMAGCIVGGLWLVGRQGASVARRARRDLVEGRPASEAAVDGLLILAAGALLIVPGFATAALGFVALFPPVRALLRPALLRWWSRRIESATRPGRFDATPFGGFGHFTVRTVVVDGGFPVTGGAARASDLPAVEAEIVDVQVNRPLELEAGDSAESETAADAAAGNAGEVAGDEPDRSA